VNNSRFDALAKTLVVSTNRRRTLSALAVGALTTVGLTDPDDALAGNSGKCTEECGACEVCKKGECHRKENGKRKCKKGKCKPRSIGTPCTSNNVTGTCQSDSRCCRVQGTACTDACPATVTPPPATTSCAACCSGVCDPINNRCT